MKLSQISSMTSYEPKIMKKTLLLPTISGYYLMIGTASGLALLLRVMNIRAHSCGRKVHHDQTVSRFTHEPSRGSWTEKIYCRSKYMYICVGVFTIRSSVKK